MLPHWLYFLIPMKCLGMLPFHRSKGETTSTRCVELFVFLLICCIIYSSTVLFIAGFIYYDILGYDGNNDPVRYSDVMHACSFVAYFCNCALSLLLSQIQSARLNRYLDRWNGATELAKLDGPESTSILRRLGVMCIIYLVLALIIFPTGNAAEIWQQFNELLHHNATEYHPMQLILLFPMDKHMGKRYAQYIATYRLFLNLLQAQIPLLYMAFHVYVLTCLGINFERLHAKFEDAIANANVLDDNHSCTETNTFWIESYRLRYVACVQMVNETNRRYGWDYLYIWAYLVCQGSSTAFVVLQEIGNFLAKPVVFTDAAKLFITVVVFFMVGHSSSQIAEQAAKFRASVESLSTRANMHNAQEESQIAYFWHTLSYNVELNAAGFFGINKGFCLTVATIALTYTFVILQFDPNAMNRSANHTDTNWTLF